MGLRVSCTRTLANGLTVTVDAMTLIALTGSNSFGCQGVAVQHIGLVYIGRVTVAGRDGAQPKKYGKFTPEQESWGWAEHLVTPGSVKGVTDRELIEIAWEASLRSVYKYGVIVFSDRINRGSSISLDREYDKYKFGSVDVSTGAFGKWLQSRPDLGVTLQSPVFNNPNYISVRIKNYSFCKLWLHFPAGRKLYADSDFAIPVIPTKEEFTKSWEAQGPEYKAEQLQENYGG